MNTENQNQNQDTVEQDENTAAPAGSSEPGLAVPTDSSSDALAKKEPQSPELKTVPYSVAPPRGAQRARRSKVAMLPAELRNWVNEQLVRQTPTGHITDYLAEQGHPGITVKNVSTWRTTGFQDYIKETETLAERDKRWNSLLKLARAQGSAFDISAMQLAIGHCHQVLSAVEPDQVAGILTDKPEFFFQLNGGLSSLMKAYVALCRLKKSDEPGRLMSPKAPASPEDFGEKNGGLTIEERDEVRRSLGIHPPPVPTMDTPAQAQPVTPPATEPML
jgi:hypothetical protein